MGNPKTRGLFGSESRVKYLRKTSVKGSEEGEGGADVHDQTKVDLVIKRLEGGQFVQKLAIEYKHAGVYPGAITNCAMQASDACAEYMVYANSNSNSNSKPPLYALTCIGTRARLWESNGRLPRLCAYFPPASAPDHEKYCDIDSNNGRELYNKLIQLRDGTLPALR